MSGALLAAALAVVLWPDRRTVRLRAASGDRRAAARPVPPVPVPVAAAVLAAGATALAAPPVVAGVAAVAAFLAGRTWLARRRDGDEEARLRSVTEGIGALAAELRAGRSLEEAAGAAVSACPDSGTGLALARALRAPGTAPGQRDSGDVAAALGRVAAAVRLSVRTGCSLAAVAAAVEDDLRARQRARQELRTATAGPRASATLLAGLPVLGLAMGSGVGADPWEVLTTTGTGQVLLVVGVALEVAGLAWTGRLVRRAAR
ncbi:UNVERIFIED_ORG: pilus assembly protein TadB [Bacillus sp. AZ43]